MKVITFTSEDSPTVLYACGNCRYTALEKDFAEQCCLCPGCNLPAGKGPGRQTCDDCRKKNYRQQAAETHVRELALPIVEDKGEPVLAGGGFFETVHDAAEAMWDDGRDVADVVAHPCTVAKAGTPDVHELIEEAWCSEFDDPDLVEMGAEAVALCAEFQAKIEAFAPTVWIPRTKERVVLPAVVPA